MLNNTKTQSRPKLLFLVPAISQTHKSLENSQDFFVKTKTFTSRPRPRLWVSRPRLYFLSSRRLETKTLVSRTTSLGTTPSICDSLANNARQNFPYSISQTGIGWVHSIYYYYYYFHFFVTSLFFFRTLLLGLLAELPG